MQLKYKQLIQSTISKLELNSSFKALANSQAFLFEEAQQFYQSLKKFKAPQDFYSQFLKKYQAHKGGFLAFLKELEPQAYDLAILIAKLAAYTDTKAPHKKIFNKDKQLKTISALKLWIHHWVNNCIQFKQEANEAEHLIDTIKNVFRYLENPQRHLPFLKESDRNHLSENLLGIPYDSKEFDHQLLEQFQIFDIHTKNPNNLGCYIYFLLNQADLKILWAYTEEDVYQQELLSKYLAEDFVAYQQSHKTQYPLNQILYGPPGTGKTHKSIRYAMAIVEDKKMRQLEQEAQFLLQKRFEQYLKHAQIAFVTFHQSMTYEDFVEGIKPKVQKQNVIYEVEAGIFKQMALRAQENPDKAYVLIIDEINRGNISSILGELITLLEPDKRREQAHALYLQLMYSKEMFCLSSNLYIIGTMNSADRSTERIDMALRRRFHFREMEPQTALLPENLEGINLRELLLCINKRIRILLDKEHCLGQSYFMQLGTFNELQFVFQTQIIPLLEEYFWGDYAKIGLVLGKGFVEPLQLSTKLFAQFTNETSSILSKPLYQIKSFPIAKDAYIAIYQDD